jgi:redox-sensitive bicupin YhaK (pirin superfamily)
MNTDTLSKTAQTGGLQIRRGSARGHTRIDWLDSRHTFSFGEYHDPLHVHFGDLRVINEDIVQPSGGFGTHGHQDMEIITYVLSGQLEHQDSLGTGAIIQAGDVQRMSAGTGIRHSEFNPSSTVPVHFLQIWIYPDRKGLQPSYEQIDQAVKADRVGEWQLLASPTGESGSLTLHQDVRLWAARLQAEQALDFSLKNGRRAWLQVTRGSVSLGPEILQAGDGVGIEALETIRLIGLAGEATAEVLLFDLK